LAKPYPLIIAEGMLERDVDLDILWWDKYVAPILHELVRPYRRVILEELRRAR